jgi:hypothetical protein
MDALRKALEAAGIECTNGQSPGVRIPPEAVDRFTRGEGSRPKGQDESGPAQGASERKG